MRRTKKASKQRGKFRIPYGGFHDVASFKDEIPNSGMSDAQIQALINEDRGANPAAAEYAAHPAPEYKNNAMMQQLADRQRMMSEHWAERQRIQEESANEKQRLLLEKQQLQMEKEAENLKVALLKLRDLSIQDKGEISTLKKQSDEFQQKLKVYSKENETLKIEKADFLNQINDLKDQVI